TGGGGTGGGGTGGGGTGGGTGGACGMPGPTVTAFRTPSTLATRPSTIPWVDTAAVLMPDGLSASTAALAPGEVTDVLTVKSLGFQIPPLAEVVGITVRVRRQAVGSGIVDHSVMLLAPGAPPVPGTSGAVWPTTLGFPETVFGGASNTWGAFWPPSVVNHMDFGFALIARNNGNAPAQPRIDSIEVTIHYAQAGATYGPMNAQTATTVTRNGGSVFWSAPTDALMADTAYARASLAAGTASHWLHLNGYFGSGTTGATPSGVLVEVRRLCESCASVAVDSSVQLTLGGLVLGQDRARPDPWSSQEVWVRYGGMTDLWGVTIPPGNPNGVFGVVLAAQSTGGVSNAAVNSARLTIFYDVAIMSEAQRRGATSEVFSRPWTSLPGATQPNDGQLASTRSLFGGELSDHLIATGFGFQVPSNATVNGVELVVTRRASATINVLADQRVGLVIGSAPVGPNRAQAGGWTVTMTDVTYGGANDLFAPLLLTPSVVNASDFGASVAVANRLTPGVDQAQVDALRMRVHYTCP
ncbi:MAG: hypothetical protein AB1938_22665, partial [Myxococcota bacterium]